jgi:hypothetical protein
MSQVKVSEIKMKFGSEFHKAKDADVIFPVIATGVKAVDDKINFYAIKQLTGDDTTSNISKTLFRSMGEGLSEAGYAIALNTADILSYRLDALGCGAYCSSYSVYLNFDPHTGRVLKLEDIISEKYLDTFRFLVLKNKIAALKKDMRQKDSMLSAGTIDSTDYNIVMEHIQQCMSEVSLDKFLLFNNELEIVDACELPHVIQALQPQYELKYSYRKIRRFIAPAFYEMMKLSP